MRFLIKFPTRERPIAFLNTIENVQETIGNVEYKFLITLDEDDESMKQPHIQELLDKLKPEGHQYFRGKSWNKIDAVNRDMIKAGNDWQVLVQISDDMKFVENRWGEVIVDCINKDFGHLDCYLHFNDTSIVEKINTMQIMGRTYFERTGTIYNPIYKTIYCDAEATFVAMMLNRYKYYQLCIFIHQHPANGHYIHDGDQLYDKNNQGAGDDQRIYESRRKNKFYVNNPETIPTPLLPYV